jgi:hypothetical protein
MALVPAQTKLSWNTKSDDEGVEENSQYDDKQVEDIITTVFIKQENSDRILRNIAILNESRYEKMFVSFNGGDIKKPDANLEQDMKATFGEAGWELFLMMLRLVNVSNIQ